MRNYRTLFVWFLAALLAVYVAGCGQETVSLPGVASVTPAQGATNVAVSTPITATFSMPMSSASITGAFTLTGPGGTVVAGAVSYSGTTATFTPTAALSYATTYTATITSGARTLGGAALIGPYVWSFTTLTMPPAVLSTFPSIGATNVPISQVVTASFNETMNTSTVIGAFTVADANGNQVSGGVTYSGLVATFTPTKALTNNMLYTATITTSATSLAGTPLAVNYVWTFTTITVPPAVITVFPASGATGVPTGQALSATFNETMTLGTITNPTTFTVIGPGGPIAGSVTYSGLVATFTPAVKLANNALYTATISTGAQSLAGTPLSNNYMWTFTTITPVPSVVSVSPATGVTNVPISQVVTASFNETMNTSTVIGAFTVADANGNQVSGGVTYSGLVATFTPTKALTNNMLYTATITTSATSLAGTPLAVNYVWTFTTVTVPPAVTTVFPANGATSVPIGQALSATFNETMTLGTITNPTTFTVIGPGGPIAGSVTYSGLVATFTPAVNLANNALYTATISTGAQSLAGTPLANNYVWTFTTITPAPSVVSVSPATGATNVPIAQVLNATFSEAMNSSNLTGTTGAATFTVADPSGALVGGTVNYSGLVSTFTPTNNFANNTVYTATITTNATSVAGTPLATNYVWTFTTIIPTPVVISTVPVNTATGVPVNQVLSATFNETINCAKLPFTAFTVVAAPGATSVAGTIACSGAVITFTPATYLAFNTVLTATVTTGVQDLAGTPLAANYGWSFRTVPAPTLPAVISTVPVNGATGVPINQALSATFSEAMNPNTINGIGASFTLQATAGGSVAGVVTYTAAGSIATFTPSANLAPTTEYTATITTVAQDLAGDSLATSYVWTFTTAAAPAAVPPTVILTTPSGLATGVPFNQIVSATFSTPMDPRTFVPATFTLTGPGATVVPGLAVYAAIGNTLTFTPTNNLAADTTFTATITTAAENLAETPLATNYVWTFTTGSTPAVIPPELVSTVPANASVSIPLTQTVIATFSEPINPLTITNSTFTLAGPGGATVGGTFSYNAINSIVTFTPKLQLAASTTYIATIGSGVTDMAGNSLGNTGVPNPWSFTTGAAPVTPPVVLGPTIALFGGFGGGAGMTNQGTSTVINGDIGTTGASTTMTGFYDESVAAVAGVYPCSYTVTPSNLGLVNGTIDTAPPPPSGACPSEGTATTMAIATQAALEAQTAYTTLQNLPVGITLATNELGNRVLAPGTYTSTSFYQITSGPLTLDAQGDANAYWIFQMGSYLTVGTPTASESVILINGAQASHVFWQVGGLPGAVINYGGGGTMVGTIISLPGITVSSPGVAAVTTINGRVLALTASTTIVNTVINMP